MVNFKVEIINKFAEENGIDSVVEFGCGDGKQLKFSNYPAYIGLDISRKAVAICKEKFADDRSKFFFCTTLIVLMIQPNDLKQILPYR